jgi:hypothetical protein
MMALPGRRQLRVITMHATAAVVEAVRFCDYLATYIARSQGVSKFGAKLEAGLRVPSCCV